MKIQSRLQWLLGLLGGIPLFLKLDYMAHAWKTSFFDRLDWVFLIVFAVQFFIVMLTSGKSWRIRSKTAVCAAVLLLTAYCVLENLDYNAMAILSAVGFWWAFYWMLFGWHHALALIAPFCVLALITTSSTYWICVYTGGSFTGAFGVKILLAILFFGITLLHCHFRSYISQRSSLFIFMMAICCILLIQLFHSTHVFHPLLLQYRDVCGKYLGYELHGRAVEEENNLLFKTSEVHHYRIASDKDVFQLLHVKCGNNIHEIHPASHCLRSSGWQIFAEDYYNFEFNKRKFGVTELQAERGSVKMLVWVWYSNYKESSGSFLSFRRLWREGGGWEEYQLAVMRRGTLEEDRKTILDLIQQLENQ